jgi:hypothetical protein
MDEAFTELGMRSVNKRSQKSLRKLGWVRRKLAEILAAPDVVCDSPYGASLSAARQNRDRSLIISEFPEKFPLTFRFPRIAL